MKRIHHDGARQMHSDVTVGAALYEVWGALESGLDVGGTWCGSADGGNVIVITPSAEEVIELYLED